VDSERARPGRFVPDESVQRGNTEEAS